MSDLTVLVGDARAMMSTLPAESVQTVVTSPPYFGLRSYNGGEAEIGTEQTPQEYVANLLSIFREVRRALRKGGTVWLNLGDSYWTDSPVRRRSAEAFSPTWDRTQTASRGGMRRTAARHGSLKNKDLIGIPWRVAFALQEDGWYLRSDCIWSKPNPMPESVRDRPTKAHEYLFLLSKNSRYYYDRHAIAEPARQPLGVAALTGQKKRGHLQDLSSSHLGTNQGGPARNKRTVWTVTTRGYKGAHFATFPPALIEPCILAGSRPGDTVLDPFGGSGTTGMVALQHGRNAVLVELNPEYVPLIEQRCGRSVIEHEEAAA